MSLPRWSLWHLSRLTLLISRSFLVTFVTPYILPSMGVNIGWIFGSVALLCVPWGILFMPELKVRPSPFAACSLPLALESLYQGRSLEEVDELFEAKIAAWKFRNYQTTGEGSTLGAMQNHELGNANKDMETEHVEGGAVSLASLMWSVD